MLRLRNLLPLLATIALLAPSAASADLFFSEYIEGSSNNKAVEIYNATGATVNLADYQIRLYSNGAAAPSATLTLSGSLLSGDVFVAAHPSANAGILAVADVTSSTAINFNGDDAVELFKISTTASIDVIGQIGFDPGTEWVVGGVSTLNMTLRRKAAVCQGDTNGANVFDPSVEWDAFAQDTIDGLGAHSSACEPTPTNNSTWGRMKSLYR